jgi:hypothetical protein
MSNQKISFWTQAQCVRRELSMRNRVYPKRIAEGRMSQTQADKELAEMTAVYATLQRLDREESERNAPSLALDPPSIDDR